MALDGAECAIQQPTSDADIPQQPRSGACDGCTIQQSNEPTILLEPTYAPLAPSTEKLARRISNCADCATEKPDGPGVPITLTSPSVKLTEHAEGCTSCAQERSRPQPPQHQSGRLKQRQAPRGDLSEPTRGRHAAHRRHSSRRRMRISRSQRQSAANETNTAALD